MLIFDDPCEEICNSKALVDIATTGRHRGLRTIYIEHLFHQSKLGRAVELQNMHIDLFKSPCDVMQVSTLSPELRLGSELVDWYRDPTSVPYGQFLIDLSQGTDDRLRYCTNTGSIPSKFYIPDRLRQLKILDDEHTKCLYSPSVPILFHNCNSLCLQSCPKEFIRFLCDCIINLLKGNRKEKNITWQYVKARFEYFLWNVQFGSKEETFCRSIKAYSSLKLLVLSSLTDCLDMEPFVLVPASMYNKSFITQSVTKKEHRNYQPLQKPTYQIDSFKKEINQKIYFPKQTF